MEENNLDNLLYDGWQNDPHDAKWYHAVWESVPDDVDDDFFEHRYAELGCDEFFVSDILEYQMDYHGAWLDEVLEVCKKYRLYEHDNWLLEELFSSFGGDDGDDVKRMEIISEYYRYTGDDSCFYDPYLEELFVDDDGFVKNALGEYGPYREVMDDDVIEAYGFFLARNDDLYKAKLVWDAIEFNYDFGFAYGGHHLIEHLIELKKRGEDDYAKKVFDFIDGKCDASQVNEFACSVFEECNNDPVKLGIAYELYSMAASESLKDAIVTKYYLDEIVLNDNPNEKKFWKKIGKCDEVVVFHSEHHEGKLIKRPDKKGGKSGKKGESRRHGLPKPLKVIYKAYKRIFK